MVGTLEDALKKAGLNGFEGTLRETIRLAKIENEDWKDAGRQFLGRIDRSALLWAFDSHEAFRSAVVALMREYLPEGADQAQGGAPHTPVRATHYHSHALSAAALEAASSTASKALLDTLWINGQPLRKCTMAEAQDWAKAHGFRVRLVDELTRNQAPTLIVGERWTDNEVEEIAKKIRGEDGDI